MILSFKNLENISKNKSLNWNTSASKNNYTTSISITTLKKTGLEREYYLSV